MKHNLLGTLRRLRSVAALLALGALTACGGGGGGGGAAAPNPWVAPASAITPASGIAGAGVAPASAVAAKVALLSSSPQIPSAGTSTVTLTAIAQTAANQTVAGRLVSFSVPNTETAFLNTITPVGGLSDPNGIVTANLNLGGNKANRIIPVTATVDGVSSLINVAVVGTTVSIAGNTSVALNATSTLTITVKDSAGVAIPSVPITVTSAAGNRLTLAPATGISDAAGMVTVTVTAIRAGADTITATAAGATATSVLTVSGDSFAFAPATNVIPQIPLNTASGVSVAWTNALGPVTGANVSFSSSRGTITPATVAAAAGTASATIQSSTAGRATITATGPGGTPSANLLVDFVATTASSIMAQATPAIVQITNNTLAQTSNSSVISVVVRDAANNLVKNARVNFTIATDPTGGALSAATAITDLNGAASVTYTAGTISSAQNGVTINATVVDVGGVAIVGIQPSSVVSLTVSGQTLFVRLGTDNIVTPSAPTNLSKTYVAVVTDAAGNPMVGVPVRFALRPGQYQKGVYGILVAPPAGAAPWGQSVSVTCANEDLNFNGILDPGENLNPDPYFSATGVPNVAPALVPPAGVTYIAPRLDPGNVATVTTSAVTDASGIASAFIVYPKNYATWAEITLEARAGVVGNDPPAIVTFWLPGLATDYVSAQISPPGVISPFGKAALCTDPR